MAFLLMSFLLMAFLLMAFLLMGDHEEKTPAAYFLAIFICP
jgi:hypothetical protein